MVVKTEAEIMTKSGMMDRVVVQTVSTDFACKAVYNVLRSIEPFAGHSEGNRALFNAVISDVQSVDLSCLEGTVKFIPVSSRCNSVLSVKVHIKRN